MENDDERQEIPTRSFAQIDKEFQQVGCLGHGAMGSVFLARKKSGRCVALKIMLQENQDDEDFDSFHREVHAVTKLLQNDNSKHDPRDLAIIFFEEWFTGPGFACIVMNHVNGPTLSQEIFSNSNPYTERRIAWYALQLSEALAYAHERGVAHYDVKSSNCLVDLSRGGRLLLADWGSAVSLANREEPVGFSEIYASPELLAAHANDDYSSLEADKVDGFGLGCILFELVCCQKLVDLTSNDQTLAEFIEERGVDAALDLPCVRLPWLPASEETPSQQDMVGYSNALRGLVMTLLQPEPNSRWLPRELQKPLRNDALSPLVANHVVAAQPQVPGTAVTIDNVQLGMFVQRGQDWDEGDSDGGPGSIGVVVKLDSDGLYTQVAWPSRMPNASVENSCCRIGAGCKFELQVGPTPMNDFCYGTDKPIKTGALPNRNNVSSDSVGRLVNNNCMVVGVCENENLLLVAPMERIAIPTVAAAPVQPPFVPQSIPRKPRGMPPPHWESGESGILVEVNDAEEKSEIIEKFYSPHGGMDIQAFEITGIHRVQSPALWKVYAVAREEVAAENWGVANEQQLFHGTGTTSPESLLLGNDSSELYRKCSYGGTEDLESGKVRFSTRASWANDHGHRRTTTGDCQVVLSRVALGRVLDRCASSDSDLRQQLEHEYQSETKRIFSSRNSSDVLFAIRNSLQAVPEYVITYKALQNGPARRIVSATRPRGVRVGGRTSNRTRPPQRQGPATHAFRGTAVSPPSTVAHRNNNTTPKQRAARVQQQQQQQQDDHKVKPSPTKQCVVCLSKPVCRILLPCGHPCLCEICSTAQGLTKLGNKCPECRKPIREAARFYGRVVND